MNDFEYYDILRLDTGIRDLFTRKEEYNRMVMDTVYVDGTMYLFSLMSGFVTGDGMPCTHAMQELIILHG